MPTDTSNLSAGGNYADLQPVPSGTQRHLSEQQLAERWLLTVRTLQRWRTAGAGPSYLRLGRRIAYRLSDVERFEASHVCAAARS